ncbi:18295_t:CDS:2 [Funneliformis geosporum]|uniref:18295_t:CDS:1 n=1 Tax=Funneliformis geosporum TaxID=1117311 RepID=A0A9W4SYB0_9GLOM|nr:18295_t:CDS:2 [Funneliformis geosporum]
MLSLQITIKIDGKKEYESNNNFVEGYSQLNEITQSFNNLHIINGNDSGQKLLCNKLMGDGII